MFKEHQDRILNLYNRENINPRVYFFTTISEPKILYSPPSKKHEYQYLDDPLELNIYYKQPIQDEEDLKLTLFAPITLPIVCLTAAAKKALYAIKYAVLACVQLATFNFEDQTIQNSRNSKLEGAKSHFAEAAKHAITALYYTFIAIMDALISIVTILTRIIATGISLCQKSNSELTKADEMDVESKDNTITLAS